MDDFTLVTGCINNDNSAIGYLYNTHRSYVHTLCKYRLIETHLSDECTNDIFLKVLKTCHTFRFEGSFRSWIRMVTINTIKDYNRKVKRLIIYVDDLIDASADIIKDNMYIDYDDKIIYTLIDLLPKKQKNVMYFHISGYSHKEISEKMNIHIGTVKSQFSRAKKKLLMYISKNE